MFVGMGGHRPEFGRFKITKLAESVAELSAAEQGIAKQSPK